MSVSSKLVAIGLILCLCVIVPGKVVADDSADSFDGIFYTKFDKEGKFVLIPTRTGSYIGLVAGAVPAALVSGGFHLFGAQPDLSMEAGRKTLKYICYPCGFTMGAPFLTLKYLLWNAPLYIAAGFLGDDKPVMKVDQTTQQ